MQHGEWRVAAHVSGFPSFRVALQFEWAFKRHCKRFGWSLHNRLQALASLLARDRWTSRAPAAETCSLVLSILHDPLHALMPHDRLLRTSKCELVVATSTDTHASASVVATEGLESKPVVAVAAPLEGGGQG